jgi:Flp pilus assembly protein TadD
MSVQKTSKPRFDVRAVYDQATGAVKDGRLDEAETICRRALPNCGEDPNILCLLGEISLRLKRPQEGRTFYARVLKTREDYPRALEGMGLALLADGNPRKAVDYLQKAAKAVPAGRPPASRSGGLSRNPVIAPSRRMRCGRGYA